MTHLQPGMPAPDFTLPDQDGSSVSLADLRGRKVIVYFYPEALTVACKQQACDFRDALPDLGEHGYAVVGISKDPVEKLARARDKDGITFPLLSDEGLDVHRAWGTFGEKNSYGRIVLGVRRSTFVLDEHGVITHAFYNTKAKGHLDMLDKRLAFRG
ncbi:thioredoxin-dependent thiol peroxidase [Agrococcus sp. Marseille-Q4369]|uniref:thioredoxin-dependent thiol peroxidase n=1 Tax=Agrococcus sp. Marseille-Q4369 TaxID=2810513 RepID=UPI001B8AEABD|nr:thioredoxin-dependent thiol peroxidase [Agrococcus sp. Marseille-Q4369]QUW18634.1 thioredoxin-dependent thiol peroxidase [Agrococcus sp. Marseille-Q4369]